MRFDTDGAGDSLQLTLALQSPHFPFTVGFCPSLFPSPFSSFVAKRNFNLILCGASDDKEGKLYRVCRAESGSVKWRVVKGLSIVIEGKSHIYPQVDFDGFEVKYSIRKSRTCK